MTVANAWALNKRAERSARGDLYDSATRDTTTRRRRLLLLQRSTLTTTADGCKMLSPISGEYGRRNKTYETHARTTTTAVYERTRRTNAKRTKNGKNKNRTTRRRRIVARGAHGTRRTLRWIRFLWTNVTTLFPVADTRMVSLEIWPHPSGCQRDGLSWKNKSPLLSIAAYNDFCSTYVWRAGAR